MRVGINGWFWDREAVGSGQYLRALLRTLLRIAPEETWILYLPAVRVRDLPPSSNVHVRVLTTPFDRLSENLAKVWFEQVAVPMAAQRDGVEVLHVPYWGPPVWSAVPVVVTVHDLIPLLLPEYHADLRVRLYNRLVAAGTRRARLVLTDSRASQADVCHHLHVPRERVWVVPLGVDARYRRVDDPRRLAEVRRKYGLPPQFILYLGGFDVRKNLDTLFAAYKALPQVGVDPSLYPLVVAGRLPSRHTSFQPDPRVLAGEHGVTAYVRFTGWVDEEDKPALYTLAEAFVYPSRYEGFGLPVLEAMACGTPVIAARASSLPELVEGAGLLVAPEDAAGLAEAMARILHNPAVRETLSRHGQERAQRFSWETTARMTLQAYRSTLTSHVEGE